MTIVRAHIEWMIDPDHPENNVVNVPHFNVGTAGGLDDADWGELAGDLAEGCKAWQSASAVPHKIKVKLYDAEAAKPNYPKAIYETQDPIRTLDQWPHELALCLSYYAVHNAPRQRGRLYICPGLCFTASAMGPYATDVEIQKIADLAQVFEDLGGVNVDWVVWSRLTHTAHAVTDYWVDNGWDVQRRRGVPGTKRVEGTTDEDSRRAAIEAAGGHIAVRRPRAPAE